MQLNDVSYPGGVPIDGYGPGFFRIGGEVHEGAVLLTPETTSRWGGLEDTAPLVALAGDIDVLFLGTGPEMKPVPADLRAALDKAGIGIEPMASPAACRTYNVLLSEGRRIAAALVPV
ncbi:Mth938-like domain-containing protein [Aestuariibius insulae]|uniref:Mth938-like domain-containing protein n=1 Tax=Aestuariibius insulae TaxID=2058287 RepID=UPI00345E81CE